MQSTKRTMTLILTLALTVTIISGCGGGGKEEKPEAKKQSTEQQGDKIPEDLTSIENSIETIFLAFNGPAVLEEGGTQGGQQGGNQQNGQQGKSQQESTQEQSKTQQGSAQEQTKSQQGSAQEQTKSQQQSTQEQTKTQQQEGTGGSRQGGKATQGGSNGQAQQQKGQQSQQGQQKTDPWQQITPIINTLHYEWNSYMPMAVKMGANRTLIDDFSSALNTLTNTLTQKNTKATMLAANKTYAYIPDFYSLYRTSSSPEIKRIRHYIRSSMLSAMTSDWTQAETEIKNLNSSWQMFKTTVSKEQQDDSTKLDFSIYELAKVIGEKNQSLTDIKGRVALSNVQSLEKAQKKASGGQGQGGGQSGGGGGSSGSGGGSGGGQS